MPCKFYLAENCAQTFEMYHVNRSDWGEGVNGESLCSSAAGCTCPAAPREQGPGAPEGGAQPRGEQEEKVRRSRSSAEAEPNVTPPRNASTARSRKL